MLSQRIGERLRNLRSESSLTQTQLAGRVGVKQETISSIENAKFSPSLELLSGIAQSFGVTVDYFLREREGQFEALLRAAEFRPEDRPKLTQFSELCRLYSELEEVMAASTPLAQPRTLPRGVDRFKFIDLVTRQERGTLGFGTEPVFNLVDALEMQGVRVLGLEFPSEHLDGMLLYNGELGAFILVNTRPSPERQLFTLAHEYGHFLFHRERGALVDYSLSGSGRRNDVEMVANAFAAALLMPQDAVRTMWPGKRKARNMDLVRMRRHFGVSFRALCWRLYTVDCIDRAEREALEGKEASLRRIERVLFPEKAPDRAQIPKLSDRLASLAFEAYLANRITVSYLAQILQTDPLTARERAHVAKETIGSS